jgi:hypothetical protein
MKNQATSSAFTVAIARFVTEFHVPSGTKALAQVAASRQSRPTHTPIARR